MAWTGGALLALAVPLAACGSSGSSSGSSSGAGTAISVPASLVAQAKKAPTQPYPSQANLQSVVIGQSVPTMSFAPLEIAEAMNFFGYLGLNVKYDTLQSGTTMQEAVVGGTVAIGADASTDTAELVAKGVNAVAIAAIMPMTLQMCVNKQYAQQHGVTPNSTLAEKAKALKGATFGITGPGALSDAADRWFVKQYGNLNPDTDITSVTTESSSLAPSVSSGKIDAFFQSAPTCQESTGGEVLTQPAQVPQFKDYANEVLFTTKAYAQSHAAITTRVATAVAMGAQFIFKHTNQAIALLEKLYPTTAPSTIDNAFRTGILPLASKSVTFTSSMWQNVNSVLVTGGTISTPISTKPDVAWTNKYIDSSAATVY